MQSRLVSTVARRQRALAGLLGTAALLLSPTARADEPPAIPTAEARSSGLMPAPRLRRGNFTRLTWDANIEGGLGGMFLGPARLTGFTRVRGGLLYVDEQDARAPKFYAFGLTYEASNFLHATSAVGVQAEMMLVKSLVWAQAGVVADFQPRPGFNLTAGWSIFGLEGQMRWDGERTQGELVWGLFGKVRLPVSWFFVGRSR